MTKRTSVGGQAVIEGVMMRGSRGVATAVRTSSGKIEVDLQKTIPYTKKHRILGLPIIRGFVTLIESLVIGMSTLNYSASFFEDESEPDKFEVWLGRMFKDKSKDIIMAVSMMISLGFAVLLFFILPTLLATVFKALGMHNIGLNIVEGLIRVGIFTVYIFLIGKMEDIKRVFQYHGAEHKTIFCYESDGELTPENASTFKRFHPRCGTNFLFLVMIVSIVMFSLTGWNTVWQRILYRIILLPIVSGITYELIRWLGKSESGIANIIAYPGLKLQELTTKEPDLSQLEVAIIALKAAEGMEYEHLLDYAGKTITQSSETAKQYTVGELLAKGYELLKSVEIESYMLDSQLLLAKTLNKSKLYVLTNRDEEVSGEAAEDYLRYIDVRKTRKPLKYILEECEFMGFNFYIKEGVLIPRPDTEVLVEAVIKEIDEKKYFRVCDVCSGSGAIGLSLAMKLDNIKVDLYDISDISKEVSEINIDKFKLSDRTAFYKSDLLQKAIEDGKEYDVIVSNPPYIKEDVIPTLMEDVKNHEPYIALCGGKDGLDFYRRITTESHRCLRNGGLLAFEIGHDQGEEVQEILINGGYSDVKCIKDLAGNDRVITGVKKI